MKSKFRLLLAMGLSVLVLGVATPLVIAHDDDTGDTTKSETEKKELTEEQKEALRKKLEEKKRQMAIQLAEFEKKLLMQKCKPAQTIVAQVVERVGKRAPQRYEIYTKLSQKMLDLVVKLQAAEVDTAELEDVITTLNTKISQLKKDIDADKVALEDLKNIDCANNTEEFKAALETARAAHQKVIADGQDIRKYVKNTLKPLLVEIRQTLEEKSEQSTEGEQ